MFTGFLSGKALGYIYKKVHCFAFTKMPFEITEDIYTTLDYEHIRQL